MKKALRVLINSQKDYGEVVSITDGYIFDYQVNRNSLERFSHETGIIFHKLDSNSLKGKVLYRYPKLNLSRDKIGSIKQDYGISITRSYNKADYRVISQKFINSKVEQLGYRPRIFTVESVLADIHKQTIDMSDVRAAINDHEFILFEYQSYTWHSNYDITYTGRLENWRWGSFMSKSAYTLLNHGNLVLDENINNIISKESPTITEEMFDNLEEMIRTRNEDDINMALNVMANSNYTESIDKIALLLVTHHGTLCKCKAWNSVGVKAMRSTFSAFNMQLDDYAHGYNKFFDVLLSKGAMTSFAVRKVRHLIFQRFLHRFFDDDPDTGKYTMPFHIKEDDLMLAPKYAKEFTEKEMVEYGNAMLDARMQFPF